MNPLRLLGLMAGILCGTGSAAEGMAAVDAGPARMLDCMAASPRPPIPPAPQFGRKGGRSSNKTPKPPVPWCTKHYAAPLPGETDADCRARRNVLKRQRKAEAASTKVSNIWRDLWNAAGRRSNRTLARHADRVLRKREKAWT